MIILLLDLSAAFDTVDHNILLSHLKSRFGINGIALDWFRSYLPNRTYTVTVLGGRSTDRPLMTGVPQGSVLGPILFRAWRLYNLVALEARSLLTARGLSQLQNSMRHKQKHITRGYMLLP